MPTADENAFVEATQGNIGVVSNLILSANPGAGEGEIGGLFDGYGQAVWAPHRDPSTDHSAWGRYEVWEHMVPSTVPGVAGLVASGDWACWDSMTREAQLFITKSVLTAKQQAEMQAVYHNGGLPTRVIGGCLVRASCLEFEAVRAQVDGRLEEQRQVDLAEEKRVAQIAPLHS
jgi:hypothetical protein